MTTNTAHRLYLEDLEPGMKFTSRDYEVTEQEIVDYARRYDPQPFHLDSEAAKGTFFGGLAASGWHTAAITMRLLVDGGLPLAGGIIGAGGELTWPSPLRPGSTVRVETTVVEITPSKSRPNRGIALCRARTLDQSGNEVQISDMKLLVFRRPPA
jgi:acyl dehydratase